MLVRAHDGEVMAIGQASHAWLSGQLARAWGNESFERPEPFEEVCLAAEQHDVGMAEWDLRPRLQEATGAPQSFMEMALDDHLTLWREAPAKLAMQSAYAALLVSMHGSALYERRDLKRMSPTDAASVRAHLAREKEWQRRQAERLSADPVRLRRNQRLLWIWDALSLAVCLDWPPYVADVPSRGDATVALRLEPAGTDAPGRFVLDPWPFPAAELQLRCEGRRLTTGHATPQALHAALEDAVPLTLDFTLTPARR